MKINKNIIWVIINLRAISNFISLSIIILLKIVIKLKDKPYKLGIIDRILISIRIRVIYIEIIKLEITIS